MSNQNFTHTKKSQKGGDPTQLKSGGARGIHTGAMEGLNLKINIFFHNKN